VTTWQDVTVCVVREVGDGQAPGLQEVSERKGRGRVVCDPKACWLIRVVKQYDAYH